MVCCTTATHYTIPTLKPRQHSKSPAKWMTESLQKRKTLTAPLPVGSHCTLTQLACSCKEASFPCTSMLTHMGCCAQTRVWMGRGVKGSHAWTLVNEQLPMLWMGTGMNDSPGHEWTPAAHTMLCGWQTLSMSRHGGNSSLCHEQTQGVG